MEGQIERKKEGRPKTQRKPNSGRNVIAATSQRLEPELLNNWFKNEELKLTLSNDRLKIRNWNRHCHMIGFKMRDWN